MSLSLLAAQYPTRPGAPTAEDSARWDHTGLRVRMLAGRHQADIERAISMHIDPTRAAAWGVPDLSSNVFRSVSRQLACLYDRPPIVDHPDGPDAAAPLIGAVDAAGLWPLMTRVSSQVIGCREYAVRVHCTEAGELLYRPISPDNLIMGASPDRPDLPVYCKELRLRKHPRTGDYQWTWTITDISEPGFPSERVVLADHRGEEGEDLTYDYLGGFHTGEAYPYRDATGAPILPVVLYHAEKHGGLWDFAQNIEVVLGSLTASVLFSFLVHAIRDASWPQRYAIGCSIPGMGLEGSGKERRQGIATDPASILMLEASGELQPQIGQWAAGASADDLLEAISAFEHRVAEMAGVSASDLQRLGGTARSGYAIAISSAGRREAQRRFEPQFREGDRQLLKLSAILYNRATGSSVPEDGYTIRYQSIPLSDTERETARKDILEKIGAGLMSKVDAYMELHPGISRKRALEELQRIQLEESATVPVASAIGGEGAAGGAGGAVIGEAPEVDAEGNIKPGTGEQVVLNGAQVTAAQGIVSAVAIGDLPRDSGLSMLVEFFGIPYDAANRIMGTVGLGFVSATAAAAAAAAQPTGASD